MIVYINESDISKDNKSCRRFLATFYNHAIKWVYQPSRQGVSWVNSIIDSSRSIEKLIKNKNVYNALDLRRGYEEGLKEARGETHLNIDDKFNGRREYVWQVFNTLWNENGSIGILNEEGIRSFLIYHARDNRAIEDVENKK